MDLVDSIEEMFQWQYCTEMVDMIPCLDGMLELPEIANLVAESTKPASTSSSTGRIVAPESSNRNPGLTVNTVNLSNSLQMGFELAPSTLPLSSAPNTPPVGKPKRSAKSMSSRAAKTAKSKASSLRLDATAEPTKAEHIIRERQRRDDMAAKYSILESLLPPVPKRERAMVVEDATSFVGALEQKKVQLLKRRADLTQIMAESPGWGKEAVVNRPAGCIISKKIICCKSDSLKLVSASSDGGVQADPVLHDVSASIGGPSASTPPSAVSAINVHVGEGEIVVEILWSQPRSNFQSALLQAVEFLGFDVKKCSILRVGNGYMQCVITCTKSQVLTQRISEMQPSSALIIRALRNVLVQSS